MINYKQKLKDINTFVFDYDGVFTDGQVTLTNDDEPLRTMNVKDAYAVQLAVLSGFNIAIITGGKSKAIEMVFDRFGIKDVFCRSRDKKEVLTNYLQANNINANTVLYMGDDIADYNPMQMVGLPCCPADAAEEIKEISLYISSFGGGKTCVRDVVSQVLKIHNKWMTDKAFVW